MQSMAANGCRGVGTCCSSQAEALHPVCRLGLVNTEMAGSVCGQLPSMKCGGMETV